MTARPTTKEELKAVDSTPSTGVKKTTLSGRTAADAKPGLKKVV